MCLFATNHFKKNIYKDILRISIKIFLALPIRLSDDCCGVMDTGCFIIIGQVQVLVGRVALIFNVVMTIMLSTYGKMNVNRKAYSDLIKNGNNLVIIREPLTVLTPC